MLDTSKFYAIVRTCLANVLGSKPENKLKGNFMQLTNVVNSNVVTMSSREIAELTGKEHKNVLADIRKNATRP